MNPMSEEDQKLVNGDFAKCYDLVQLLAAMMPTTPKIWTGTVSERLQVAVEALKEHYIKAAVDYITAGNQDFTDVSAEEIEKDLREQV